MYFSPLIADSFIGRALVDSSTILRFLIFFFFFCSNAKYLLTWNNSIFLIAFGNIVRRVIWPLVNRAVLFSRADSRDSRGREAIFSLCSIISFENATASEIQSVFSRACSTSSEPVAFGRASVQRKSFARLKMSDEKLIQNKC